MNVEAKLGLLNYKKAPESHILIKDAGENGPCLALCQDRPCATVCPANVYAWEEHKKKIVVSYENCIECGACRMLCPFDNIKCDWPRGGFGVQYRWG